MSKENVKEISVGECYGLNRAIFELSSSTPSLKGKIVYALSKNEAKLESVLRKADERQKQILKKYVALNEDGSFKFTKLTEEEIGAGKMPEYIYTKESDKGKAEEEVKEIINEKVEIELHKIWKNDFDNIDISLARNQNINLIIEHLVSEIKDLQLM